MIIRGGTFGPVATNTYIVADARGGSAWVVDPAMGSSAWAHETLSRLEATPVAVLDTHGHWDHIVENHVWAAEGLPVWVAEADADWLEAPSPFNPALFGNLPPTPGRDPRAPPRRRRRARARRPALPAARDSRALARLHGGARGDARRGAGGRPHLRQGIGRTDFPRSDPRAMLASLERIFDELPRETRIYPGHDPWAVTLGEAEPYARMFM